MSKVRDARAPANELQCDVLEHLAATGHRVRLRVTGRSMAPAIRERDWIEAAPVPAAALRVGDIALGLRNGAAIAHRVISRSGNRLQTCGDATWSVDPAFDHVIGRVVSIERPGRGKWSTEGTRAQVRGRLSALAIRIRLIAARVYASARGGAHVH